ncbi:limonene-1,2-epoxide hydrolase [Rossellomorea marisflavi]
MVKVRLKVDHDSNKVNYIKVIRRTNGESIQGIKQKIEDNQVVLECDYFDLDALRNFKKTIEILISKGAIVHVFQDEREIQEETIQNLIGSYEQIADDRKRFDHYIGNEERGRER